MLAPPLSSLSYHNVMEIFSDGNSEDIDSNDRFRFECAKKLNHLSGV